MNDIFNQETLQSNTKIKQKLKEIDDFSIQEEETLKKMKDLKFQGLEELSNHENEYRFFLIKLSKLINEIIREIYNESQKLIESTQNSYKLANEKLNELEKHIQNKQSSKY